MAWTVDRNRLQLWYTGSSRQVRVAYEPGKQTNASRTVPEIDPLPNRAGSLRGSNLVQVFDEPPHGTVHALYFGILRLNHVVFIRRVSVTSVSETKVAGSKGATARL